MKLLLILTISLMSQASTWNSFLLNREALKNLKSEAPGQSLQSLIGALESEPMNPLLHLNLGVVLMTLEEAEKAAQAFSSAAALASGDQQRFVAKFNQAVALGEAKQIDKALEAYQSALTMDPDNLEIKTNIELLMKSEQNQDGDGKGEQPKGEPKKDPGEGQGQGQNDQEQRDPPPQKKPKDFKSEELTASDVKKILEELKSQEQGIRAKEFEKGPKERPSGKDW